MTDIRPYVKQRETPVDRAYLAALSGIVSGFVFSGIVMFTFLVIMVP